MIIQQRDQYWWHKLNGATRLAIVKGALNVLGRQLVVTEYPKSGGTWLSQMLSAATGIPYPRNRLPHFGQQLIHGSYLNVSKSVGTVVTWRDGRDIMVSYFNHFAFEKKITSAKFSQELKKRLSIEDPRDIQTYLPRFIEWSFNGGYPGFSWNEFVDVWIDRPDAYKTSYEALHADAVGELEKALSALNFSGIDRTRLQEVVDEYSFENQTSRKPGEEDVTQFVRKGIVGDWKNGFTREAKQVFDHYAGDVLIRLGYEKDRSWVDE